MCFKSADIKESCFLGGKAKFRSKTCDTMLIRKQEPDWEKQLHIQKLASAMINTLVLQIKSILQMQESKFRNLFSFYCKTSETLTTSDLN